MLDHGPWSRFSRQGHGKTCRFMGNIWAMDRCPDCPNASGIRRNPFARSVINNRAGEIRTRDLLNPIQAHYQAVLRPVFLRGATLGVRPRLGKRFCSFVACGLKKGGRPGNPRPFYSMQIRAHRLRTRSFARFADSEKALENRAPVNGRGEGNGSTPLQLAALIGFRPDRRTTAGAVV
ncbi:MAG: hypothetical protein JWL90_4579 [Chthoniobacteraceae bacterium]|nr:hypothetical protein [Chthoniobacteraceae bacterium]